MARSALAILGWPQATDGWKIAYVQSVLGYCLLRRGEYEQVGALRRRSQKILGKTPESVYAWKSNHYLEELEKLEAASRR